MIIGALQMVILYQSSLPIPVVEKRGDESIETQKKSNKTDKRKLRLQKVPEEG